MKINKRVNLAFRNKDIQDRCLSSRFKWGALGIIFGFISYINN